MYFRYFLLEIFSLLKSVLAAQQACLVFIYLFSKERKEKK